MTVTPTEWDDVTIADFGEIVGGGTPSRATPSFWNGTIPWVTPTEITALHGKYVRDTQEMITPVGLAGSAAKLLPVASVVVTTRASIGMAAIAAVPLTTNQGFKNIIPNRDTDSLFTYYRIQTLKSEMVRLASGTTFLEISKADFSRLRTRRPKRAEQSRIAVVLDTLDQAITRTEAVTAKLRQMRAGLLHDLLTCGIGHNGQLRDPIANPDQFKHTFLGLIPKEWEERTIDQAGEVTKLAGFEFTNFIHYSTSGEIIALRALNIKNEELDLSDIQRISKAASDSLPRSKVNSGDILITYIGAYIGDVVLIEDSDRYHLAPNIAKITCNRGILPNFMQWQIRSPTTRRQMAQFTTTTATPSLTMTQIRELKVAIPVQEIEQRKIVEIVNSANRTIQNEVLMLDKLTKLKSGLMADLLTGRVRTPAQTPTK